jgi:hypothetical protein
VAIALGSCAPKPPAIPALPSQGGPAWLELTTEHFDVWTDASAEQGRALIRAMEHLRQVIYGVSFMRPTSPSKCIVVALRNVEEVHAFAPEQFIAETWSASNPLMQPVIILPIDHLEDDRRIITHELTHMISYGPLPSQPHWFAEGLATYFETMQLDESKGVADVGAPLDNRMSQLHLMKQLPIASLIACSQPSCMDERYYATAWALFTFLVNAHPNELDAYLVQLGDAGPGAHTDGWPRAFAGLAPEKLDRELATWLAYGKITVSHFNVKLQEWPVSQRPLADGDVYATRGMLRSLVDWTGPLPQELAQAFAVDPTNVVARVIQMAHERGIAIDIARSVQMAHPDDWRAWLLLAHALHRGSESRTARQKVCELLDKNPAVLPKGICPIP